MAFPLVPLAVGALSAGAGYLASKGQSEANKRNIRLAREQMAFQERMSSTAWQRAVADMKMAGINPMLSYMKGGASSPGGAMPRTEDVLGPAVSSAIAMRRLSEEVKNMQSQRKLMYYQSLQAMSQSSLTNAKAISEIDFARPLSAAQRQFIRVQNKMMSIGMPAAKVTGSKLGGILRLLFRSGGALSPIKIPGG